MKEVAGKVVIKKDTDFWKSMQKVLNEDPEEAAAKAAERARQEVIERNKKRAAEQKAYEDSLRDYDSYPFENKVIRAKINKCRDRIGKLNAKLSKEYKEAADLRKELQSKCSHKEVIERGTTWQDEYEEYHPGYFQRKCIDCGIMEESSYRVNDRSYEHGSKKYDRLEKSQVVLLRKKVGNKEFELEFKDLEWQG